MNAVVPLENQPAQMLVQLGTLQASTPAALVSGATQIADTLATIIRKNKLASLIQGKEYVRVEGWTTLAALLGVIPREDSVEALEDGGYIAKVSLVRMADGAVISSASSECGMDEPTWANRARYARRSMAVTRATGKAARLAFSWVMALAGFEATPAEEMNWDRQDTPALELTPAQTLGKRLVAALEVGIDEATVEVFEEGLKDKKVAEDAWKLLTHDEQKRIGAILKRANPPVTGQ